MLEVIRKARARSPLGLLELDEHERGGRTVYIDEHGEQWQECGRVLCAVCDEDGRKTGNKLTAQEGWTHLLTGATVCTDCTGFTSEEFPLTADEQLDLFAAVAAGDGAQASAILREAGERRFEVAH